MNLIVLFSAVLCCIATIYLVHTAFFHMHSSQSFAVVVILNSITQLLYQLLHIYKVFIKFTQTLKTLRHVSVLGPSSGSHIVPAKVTL